MQSELRDADESNEEYIGRLLSIIEGMREDVDFLECLRAAGVDNWDGFDYAAEMFHEGGE